MKNIVLLAIATAMILPVPVLAKTILPDACGDDKVKFEVKTEKDQPPPAAPEAGKAQIVFVEDNAHMVAAFHYATVRFGLDGAWAGAAYGDSYFVVPVAPGEHHLCADWEGNKRGVGTAAFTAEAGKVYYFAAKAGLAGGGGGEYVAPTMGANGAMTGGGHVAGAPGVATFDFGQLSEDDGKYRVKAWKLATSKANK